MTRSPSPHTRRDTEAAGRPWLMRIERALRLVDESQDAAGALAEAAVTELGADRAEVWLYDPATATLRPRSSAPGEGAPAGTDPVSPAYDDRSLLSRALLRRETLFEDPRAAANACVACDRLRRDGMTECAALPLLAGDRILGVALLGRRAPFTEEARSALPIVARQAALTLDRARVLNEARGAREASVRQLDRLTALARITHRLLAAEELDTIVRVVAEAASRLCDAAGAMVQLIDDDRQHLTVLAAHGEPRDFFEQFHTSRLTDAFYAETIAGRSLADRRAVAVEDYAAWPTGYGLKPLAVSLGIHAIVAAPLLVDGAPIGLLWVSDTAPRPFTTDDITLVEALADQAALAIQHARLRARGEEVAMLEERARLARELHDSVSQGIFSFHLMANAAIAQHERGAATLAATLARMRTIAQDTLTEMRSLIYELRPAVLEDEGLSKALPKLIAAVQVRSEVPVSFDSEGDARPTREAEHAIFRIVQESLANATKYARASRIAVSLLASDGRLRATVTDDGIGFDPTAPPASSADGRRGGVGLRSMRERAVAAGLTLRVESAPGAGCRVIVEAPALEPEA